MNILIITAIYPEPKEYGIKDDTLIVHYFARYWVKMGHRVMVLHPYYNGIGNIKHYLSMKDHKIKCNKNDGVDVIFGEVQMFVPHQLKPLGWRSLLLAKRMRCYMKEHFPDFVPDVLSVHFPVVLHEFTSQFLDLPKLAVFHGTDIRLLQDLNANSRNNIVEKLNKVYDILAYRSPKLREAANLMMLNDSKAEVLISGIDNKLLANFAVIEKKYQKDKIHTLNIVFAGKLVNQKRINVVLQALSRIKNDVDFRFDIIGDGPVLKDLRIMSNQCGINDRVVFHGRKSREEVSKYMSEADMFIMVSTNETLGLVYLEAMAQGCITVGSRGEGIDGIIVDGKNGYLVDPYNIPNISDTIRSIYTSSQETRKTIILNAYNDMKNITDIAMSNKYLNTLKQIINKNE